MAAELDATRRECVQLHTLCKQLMSDLDYARAQKESALEQQQQQVCSPLSTCTKVCSKQVPTFYLSGNCNIGQLVALFKRGANACNVLWTLLLMAVHDVVMVEF
jgi:hypothetical protein